MSQIQDKYVKALQIHLSQCGEGAARLTDIFIWLRQLHLAADVLLKSGMFYVPFLLCKSYSHDSKMDDSPVKDERDYQNQDDSEELEIDESDHQDNMEFSKTETKTVDDHPMLWKRTSTSTCTSSGGDDQPEDLRMEKADAEEMEETKPQLQNGHHSHSIPVV